MRNAVAAIPAAPLPIAARPSGFRGPVRFLSLVGVASIPFVLASVLDAGGLRTQFDNVHWNLSAIGGTAAVIWAIRGTTGRIRTVRTAAAAALALWAVSTLLWSILALADRASIPSIADLFVFAIVAPGVAIMVAAIRGRMTRAEETAVYLDAALVVILILSVLLHVHGPAAAALPTGAGFIALAYPTAFIGLAAAGSIALLAAGYPISARGPLPLLAGSAILGIAYLGWVVPTVTGSEPGELSSVLFTVGTLVAAYGAATWTDELAPNGRYRERARYLARIAGPIVASALLLTVVVPAPPMLETVFHLGLIGGGAVFMTREGLLLRERTAMLASVTALTSENARLVHELRTELDRRAHDERRLIQASRAAAVGELAAGVAHEVNNPLTGVLGFAELLLADLDPDDPHHGDVTVIRDEALRARRIIQGLREFAAPAPPTLAPTDLSDLIRRTVDLVRYSIVRRGVDLVEDLPELPTALVDPHAIQQALLNVLTNASQAVADNGRIEIALRTDGGELVIDVRDDGTGMDAATLSLAMEPFFSGRPDEPGVPPARGLGLSITSGLVESHGGSITLESQPGRGTAVEIRLPAPRPGDVRPQLVWGDE
jgi:signal transduction histidine kinase